MNELKIKRYNQVKFALTEMGYMLHTTLENYKNNNTPLHTVCPNGHVNKNKSWANFQRGRKCRQCWDELKMSKGEKEVKDYVILLGYVNILENNRTIIRNPITGNMLELDIWLPGQKKAIEYNGDYWHIACSDNDVHKINYCNTNGISLLVVWDSMWTNHREETEQKIKEFLNNDEHIVDVGNSEWQDYYENHYTPFGTVDKYKIITPEYTEDIITNGMLRKYCDEHNLSYASLIRIANGWAKSHKGYTIEHINEEMRLNAENNLKKSNQPTGINLKNYSEHTLIKDGKVYVFDNIQKFSNEHDLTKSAVGLVLKGKRKQHKGFTVPVI